MSYTLTVTYKLPLIDVPGGVYPVSPVFGGLKSNYASDPSYTEAQGNAVWDTKVVNKTDITSVREVAESSKSVYATNTDEYGIYDSEIYAHSISQNPIPLHKFEQEIFPIATYDSDSDTYTATLTVETPASTVFTSDDKDATEAYYTAIAEALPNVSIDIQTIEDSDEEEDNP